GPAVNVVFFIGCLGGLTAYGIIPPMNPLWNPYNGELYSWFLGGDIPAPVPMVPMLLARFFYVNWMLFWVNILVMGFPLACGRIFQAALWPRYGFHASMRVAIYAGYTAAAILVGIAFIFHKTLEANSLMLAALAIFIFLNCRQQQMQLEMGGLGEDSLFGY